MCFLLNMVISHCYVSLPEGSGDWNLNIKVSHFKRLTVGKAAVGKGLGGNLKHLETHLKKWMNLKEKLVVLI